MFAEFFENSPDGFHMILVYVFSVNQDIIKVYNNENIQFFCWNFVDVVLEAGRSIRKTEGHDLVLEIAVPRLESCFLLVTFLNSHSMICAYQVQLSKTLSAT